MRPHELVGAGESVDAGPDSGREVFRLGEAAGRQGDQGRDHREDVLDAMAELLAEQLLGLLHALQVVDVGAGAVPADDLSRLVAQGHGPAQGPAVDAVVAAQAVFDLVGLAGLQRMSPARPGALLVFGMEHVVPAFAVGRAVRHAGELVPAGVIVVVEAVRSGRPDHLRHGVGDGGQSLAPVAAPVLSGRLLGISHAQASSGAARPFRVH